MTKIVLSHLSILIRLADIEWRVGCASPPIILFLANPRGQRDRGSNRKVREEIWSGAVVERPQSGPRVRRKGEEARDPRGRGEARAMGSRQKGWVQHSDVYGRAAAAAVQTWASAKQLIEGVAWWQLGPRRQPKSRAASRVGSNTLDAYLK
jgi:hypothetical protein